MIGLYLSLNRDVLSIFGITDEQEIDDIIYVNWLSLIWAGVGSAPQMYNPTSKEWLQAHSQARYVISRVLIEAGQNFVTVVETEDGKNLRLTVDRTKITTVGRDAVANFLLEIQTYKSIGDIENASKLYGYFSSVEDIEPYLWGKWRDIVLAHKKPRPILLQSNTELQGISQFLIPFFHQIRINVTRISFFPGETVAIRTYEPTFEGYIQSAVDRFQSNEEVCDILEAFWEENKKHFPSSVEC